MKRKLTVVHSTRDLRNIVFLGPNAPFNLLDYDRVLIEFLDDEDKKRVVSHETCKKKCEGCEKLCVRAVVKLKPQQTLQRFLDIRRIFPKF